MPAVVVVGTQWGDEGKGKITDFLAEQADVVARYQGGDNAGHTINIEKIKYKLHLIPSGIFYSEKICVLGNGMVINPKAIIKELNYLHENGFSTSNLRISSRAHVIMPYHIMIDKIEEELKGDNKIGTTCKGIGPAYMDKAARIGIRMVDFLDPEEFRKKLEIIIVAKNKLFEKYYEIEGFSVDKLVEEYAEYRDVLRPYITDTSVILNDSIDQGKQILFEGAQGVMLDIDQGTYPYVTSSNPVAGGVTIGSGVGPTKINHVVGVSKAYTSRVGDGPFPTELNNKTGDFIREVGHEYGTTTGRPRRVGWFDSVVVRHAKRVSGITELSLNSVDVLTGLDKVKICIAYKYREEIIENYPASLNELVECEPIYEELPGWTEDISNIKNIDELPQNAKNYIKRITELTGIPIAVLSIGPNRNQTISLKKLF